MNDIDTDTTCECGKPALTDPDGYVTTIFNGMIQMPVCDECWRDPENIAVEVCVQTALSALTDRLPHDVKFAHLATPTVIAMGNALSNALAARGMENDIEIAMLVASRWDEWYAA